MTWVVDGNNLLGRAGIPREGDDARRALVRLLGAFARERKTRVWCCFDGPEPEAFGRLPRGVSIAFSGTRSADDRIAEYVSRGSGWKVVTSDRGLAARLPRRGVEIVETGTVLRELETLARDQPAEQSDDWQAYFSDPKNRNVF